MTNNYKNPFLDSGMFKLYNFDNLIDAWNIYFDKGIGDIRDFLESILSKFSFLEVEYVPFFLGAFLPKFILRVSKSLPFEKEKAIWNEIFWLAYDYCKSNGLVPIFNMINFSIRDYRF